MANKSAFERFCAQVQRGDGCWEWQGTKFKDGYGRFFGMGHTGVAHRFAWAFSYGAIPAGMLVCHACDNHACCRNDDEGWYEVGGVLRPRRGHLWLGTSADNAADMAAKGRQPVGEKNGFSWIADATIGSVRRDFEAGISRPVLAAKYGISTGQIWNITTYSQRKGQTA